MTEYPCSLERKGVERRGLLLVTPRHVCFHSPRLNTRVAIYWRVITSLSRATAVNGTVPAIYVTCLGAYHEEVTAVFPNSFFPLRRGPMVLFGG